MIPSVIALLGFAAAAPAQLHFQGFFGRHFLLTAEIGCFPPACAPVARGHWETTCEQVLVPGCWREERVPPRYGWIPDRCGHWSWGVVESGGCRRTWVPAHYETQRRRAWVAGC